MRIKLTDERKNKIAADLAGFFMQEFDEEISEFRAMEIVEFMLRKIGPSQYNQAVSDVRAYMTEKIDDLDIEFSEPEDEGP